MISTLIIPVESQVRELDAKLLLACIAAEQGFPVIIGSRAFTHFEIASIPRGVYLAKSMRGISSSMFTILRQLIRIFRCGYLPKPSGRSHTYFPGEKKTPI